jgi:hypothetical protein
MRHARTSETPSFQMRSKLMLMQTTSLLLVVTGCGTPSENSPPTLRQGSNPHWLEIDGLVLSVYPITKKAEVKKTFGLNLLAEGVIPIKVVAENNSSSSSFIITKDKVVVMTETSGAPNSTHHGEAAKDLARVSREQQVHGKELAPLAVLTTPPILVLMGLMTPIDPELIDRGREYKLATKEFYTRTLQPGQRAEGFIFYRAPNGRGHAGAYHLVAQVKNSSKEVPTEFDIKLNLNLEPR